jgi:hypothetical protein
MIPIVIDNLHDDKSREIYFGRTCEKEADRVLEKILGARDDILESGGAIWGIPFVPGNNCSECARKVAGSGWMGEFFALEAVNKFSWFWPSIPLFPPRVELNTTHAWVQIRCKATGEILGTVDIWEDINDFYRTGCDSFGWTGENHGELTNTWIRYCDAVRKNGNPGGIVVPTTGVTSVIAPQLPPIPTPN